MLLICYPKCSTCKKTEKWLAEKGVEYQCRDIQKDNPNKAELAKWLKKSGLDIGRFFNTSGMVYRALNLSQKRPEMSEDEQLALLATDGMLVKRPLLIADDFILVGFKQAEWEAKFS